MWHAISLLRTVSPPAPATLRLVRQLLTQSSRVELENLGDGMWPAIRNGQQVTAVRSDNSPPHVGEVIVADRHGRCELLRVESLGPDGDSVSVAKDAVPGPSERLPTSSILAGVETARTPVSPLRRSLHRTWLDILESRGNRLPERNVAQTVEAKYTAQAEAYAAAETPMASDLVARIRARHRDGARVLVVGSGVGGECLALAKAGFATEGVDFAAPMIAAARQRATDANLPITFHHCDIGELSPAPHSFDLVFFTYDVYSFLPARDERIALLSRMRTWLRPRGSVMLSARMARTNYNRALATLHWLHAPMRRSWGDAHTRWWRKDGEVAYSFVHLFTQRGLAREIHAAGFSIEERDGGHWLLLPSPDTGRP